MLWIVGNSCVLIEESGSGLLKGDAMLSDVLTALDFVPDEVYIIHIVNVYTVNYSVNSRWATRGL
jgi:DNA polymerase III psi subunit